MAEQPDLPSPVAAVILAAGAASRMGQPKLLLPWKGEALIRHAARTALQAGLDPVVVVTGAASVDMQTALSGLELKLVFNPDWQAGQSTSVRIGIQSLPAQARAVIFLLGDQPFVSVELLKGLVRAYLETQPLILAPFVAEKRANPVLFDRAVFGEMQALQGDAGARTIFSQHPPTPFPWPDERLLFDVDTPEDYQRLVG
jgi:molybdenum cofactor cytidylyltransferase